MIRILVLAILYSCFSGATFAQKSTKSFQRFHQTDFEYLFLKGKLKKDKHKAKTGDRIQLAYEFAVEDSVIYGDKNQRVISWIALNNNYSGNNATLGALPNEILHYLSLGDSVHVRIPIKSFFEIHKITPPAAWPKDGFVNWKIKVLGFQTEKEHLAALAKARSITNDFRWVDDALEYKMIAIGKTLDKPTNVGDLMTILVNYKIADSLIFSSSTIDEGKAVPHQINQPTGMGDLMNGFLLLQEGDSAIFRIKAKDLAKLYNTPVPDFVKEDDYHSWEVRVVTHKTPQQVQQEKDAHAKKQNAIDSVIIYDYFKAQGYEGKTKNTSNGLVYVVIEDGNGELPKAGATVVVNYTGMFTNGRKFDSNVDPAFNHVTPFSFTIGKKQVIDGWDQILQLMPKGSKYLVAIPSVLGYGERSNSAIPANSVLVFEIELIDIK